MKNIVLLCIILMKTCIAKHKNNGHKQNGQRLIDEFFTAKEEEYGVYADYDDYDEYDMDDIDYTASALWDYYDVMIEEKKLYDKQMANYQNQLVNYYHHKNNVDNINNVNIKKKQIINMKKALAELKKKKPALIAKIDKNQAKKIKFNRIFKELISEWNNDQKSQQQKIPSPLGRHHKAKHFAFTQQSAISNSNECHQKMLGLMVGVLFAVISAIYPAATAEEGIVEGSAVKALDNPVIMNELNAMLSGESVGIELPLLAKDIVSSGIAKDILIQTVKSPLSWILVAGTLASYAVGVGEYALAANAVFWTGKIALDIYQIHKTKVCGGGQEKSNGKGDRNGGTPKKPRIRPRKPGNRPRGGDDVPIDPIPRRPTTTTTTTTSTTQPPLPVVVTFPFNGFQTKHIQNGKSDQDMKTQIRTSYQNDDRGPAVCTVLTNDQQKQLIRQEIMPIGNTFSDGYQRTHVIIGPLQYKTYPLQWSDSGPRVGDPSPQKAGTITIRFDAITEPDQNTGQIVKKIIVRSIIGSNPP